MEHFYIQDPEIDAAIVKIRDIMRKYSVKPYNESDNTGTYAILSFVVATILGDDGCSNYENTEIIPN